MAGLRARTPPTFNVSQATTGPVKINWSPASFSVIADNGVEKVSAGKADTIVTRPIRLYWIFICINIFFFNFLSLHISPACYLRSSTAATTTREALSRRWRGSANPSPQP